MCTMMDVITDAAIFAPNLFVKAFLADDFIRIFHQMGQQAGIPVRSG